ncbi:MAG: ATP-binding cassette domain-containing protein [Flavobacteriaceae bacterium]|jgi:ABC-2 type transport system ATP-binding protein|nr:ATP-binding cassette domain-containing protein [Flavobacteriaceae bacterium]
MFELFVEKKRYGKSIILKDVKINLTENGIYGFFGKNGQGKTTLFHCILGFTKYKGRVLFNGEALKSSDIGWIPTDPDLYEYLTAKEFMNFYAVNCGKEKADIHNLLFDLDNNKLIKECSTGMKKKVYINSVLQIPDYKLYIFDEPFNGLDIEANYLLLNYIKELAKNNMVFLSSHIIEIVLPYLEHCYFIDNTSVTKYSKEDLMLNFTTK